jgi:hypothetical protein
VSEIDEFHAVLSGQRSADILLRDDTAFHQGVQQPNAIRIRTGSFDLRLGQEGPSRGGLQRMYSSFWDTRDGEGIYLSERHWQVNQGRARNQREKAHPNQHKTKYDAINAEANERVRLEHNEEATSLR